MCPGWLRRSRAGDAVQARQRQSRLKARYQLQLGTERHSVHGGRARDPPICTQAAARRWASGGAPKGLYVAAARPCVAEPVGSRITSRAGPVLILGRQRHGPLLNSDGGGFGPRRVGWIAPRRILAPPGGVLSALAKPRPHRSRRAPGVVARGVPRDLRGHTAGDVVRQASDDDRDGGNVLGRLAWHGQHGVVLAAARPAGTSGELLG